MSAQILTFPARGRFAASMTLADALDGSDRMTLAESVAFYESMADRTGSRLTRQLAVALRKLLEMEPS